MEARAPSPTRAHRWSRRVRDLTAAVVAIACVAGVATAEPALAKRKAPIKRATAARVNPQLRGVQLTPNRAYTITNEALSDAENAREMQSACALGANLVRVNTAWSWLEKSGPDAPDPQYLATLDRLMTDAQQCGIKVLLMFAATPPWASDSGSLIAPPLDIGQFRRVVGFMLRRYPSIYALEVWNEPNLAHYWAGTPAQYADLVDAAVAAKRDVGSSTQILAGALSLGATDYLQQLYAAGMRGQDGISVHPYSVACTPVCSQFLDPSLRAAPFRSAIENVHQTMLANHDSGGVWLTEFGFPTCPAHPGCVSDAEQASWMAQSVRVAACYPYVRGLTAFTLRDIPVPESWDSSYFELHFGLMDADFHPKPAFGAVRSVFTQLNGGRARTARAASKRKRARKRPRAIVPGTVGSRLCQQITGRSRATNAKARN